MACSAEYIPVLPDHGLRVGPVDVKGSPQFYFSCPHLGSKNVAELGRLVYHLTYGPV